MGHEVRTHTRRLPDGRTVTVRQHSRTGDGTAPADAPLDEKDQDRRDRFERRALHERQEQRKAQRGGKQPARAAGERRKRKPKAVVRARRHAKKAARLWRRHKVKAVAYGVLALGEITFHGVRRGAARVRSAVRRARGKRR